MRSILLSLLAYFLILLGLALGSVALLVYELTQKSLRDQEAKTAEVVNKRYNALCDEQKTKLDDELLHRPKIWRA